MWADSFNATPSACVLKDLSSLSTNTLLHGDPIPLLSPLLQLVTREMSFMLTTWVSLPAEQKAYMDLLRGPPFSGHRPAP